MSQSDNVELNHLTTDNEHTAHPPKLGRRRFLTTLTGGLFGLAAKAFVPSGAQAAPTPWPCENAPGCDTCSGTTCTGCYNGRSYDCRGQPGRTCWLAQGSQHSAGCWNYWNCCDWFRSDFSVCICRGYAGVLCQARAA